LFDLKIAESMQKLNFKLGTMRKATYFILSVVLVSAIVSACKHHPEFSDVIIDDNGNGTVNPPDTIDIINTDPCDPDTVYFSNTIAPLLNSMCATEDCHDNVDPEDDVMLYEYSLIMEQVSAGSPNNSDLWEAITETDPNDQMPPVDSPQLTSEQMQQIQTWILQGAQNNSCQADCNPADFSFATNIQPVVEGYCVGCHGGSSPDGDLLLETYDQIKSIALDGRLMDALLGANGASIMPDNTTGLPDCNITNFQNWIDAGAPNN
jgi:mono/diheme cytochrome c family protein